MCFLGHMGDFMGHDAGEFALRVGIQYHAAVNPDNAAGRGKRVDQVVVNNKKGELLFVVVALGNQLVAD